jgi:hypothetical protein
MVLREIGCEDETWVELVLAVLKLWVLLPEKITDLL